MHEDIIDAIRKVLEPVVNQDEEPHRVWIEADSALWAKLEMVQQSIQGHEDKDWSKADIFIDAFETKFERVMGKATDETVLEIIKTLADHAGIEMKAVNREEFEATHEDQE